MTSPRTPTAAPADSLPVGEIVMCSHPKCPKGWDGGDITWNLEGYYKDEEGQLWAKITALNFMSLNDAMNGPGHIDTFYCPMEG